jgi:tripartite-type tricarboxylate transporter receptor subunit TctC
MRVAAVAAALAASLMSGSALSQGYPDRTVTVIVPYAPGGNTDVFARIMLEGMAPYLGQRFVIENVSGAGGTTGSLRAAKAAPDGSRCWSARWARMRRLSVSMATSSATIRSTTSSMCRNSQARRSAFS